MGARDRHKTASQETADTPLCATACYTDSEPSVEMTTRVLTQREIKEYREKQLKRQRGICPLCKTDILVEEATLDHCHDTGRVRQVLHRSCNSAEGRILALAGRRSRGEDPDLWLRNLLRYWKKSYTSNPVHPAHGRKRPRRKRKKRSKK